MTTQLSVNIHFDAGDVGHRVTRGYATLDIGNGEAHLYFEDVATIDAAIAHLAEMKTEMLAAQEPKAGTVLLGALRDRVGVGEPVGRPGDEIGPAALCDSELPLKHGGTLKCTLDAGHYGMHSAIAGDYRWLGHGADARDEEGNKIAPIAVPATATCGHRPYPAGSEGDDGTWCVLPAGHTGHHSDEIGPAE